MREAAIRALSSRRAPFAIIALALLLASPSLSTGLVADDYYHALILAGGHSLPGVPDDPWALFRWADGTVAMSTAFMEVGMVGWWSDPQLLMSFMRPVSVLTHRLDHRLYPDTPWLMHAHTLLWFAGALFGLSRLYPRVALAGQRVSGQGRDGAGQTGRVSMGANLCLLLFALDDAHGLSLSWVANRNAVVALCLAVPVLLLHDRARRERSRAAAAAGPALLLCSLLAGEVALAACAYLFAYGMFLDPMGRRRGLLSIAPHAVVVVGWSIAYRALGFGARGSGLVVDPGSEPLRFAFALAERLPALLAAQLALPPADLWEFYGTVTPWLPGLMLGAVCVVLLLLAVAMRDLWKTDPAARFWALGMLLAAVPVCAQFPHDRLLMFVGVGGMGLVGRLLARWLTGQLGGLARVVAVGLVALHLVLGPTLLPVRVRAPADIRKMIGAADATIDQRPGVEQRTVVLINPPADAYAGYIPPLREAEGRPRPAHLHWLATAASEVEVERLDDHTLRVRPRLGFLARASERMQRGDRAPMRVGHRVVLTEMTITVTESTPAGRPLEVLARFTRPFSDPQLYFQAWSHGRFVPFEVPPRGKPVTLPAVDFSSLLP